MTGQPASLLNTTLRRMNQESGGNPNAINNWDSNALAGIPSQGLMQVIPPTFAAYAMPGYNSNILDPMSNILASMRYAIDRYGSLAAAYNQAGGYATGGVVPTLYDSGGWLPQGLSVVENRTGRPEPVFTGAQFDAMKHSGGTNVGSINVYAHTNASAVEIASEMGWALQKLN